MSALAGSVALLVLLAAAAGAHAQEPTIRAPSGSKLCHCELHAEPQLSTDSLVASLGSAPLVAGGLTSNSYVSCEEAKLFCPRACADLARRVLSQNREGALFPPSGAVADNICSLSLSSLQTGTTTTPTPTPTSSSTPTPDSTLTQHVWLSHSIMGCSGVHTQYVGEACCVQREDASGAAVLLAFDCRRCPEDGLCP